MPEPLKDLFTPEVVAAFGRAAAGREPAFDDIAFMGAVLDAGWPALELKQRIRRVAQCLYDGLPGAYPERIKVLMDIRSQFNGLVALVFPDVVEVHGLDHWEPSMKALEAFTPLCSSEFAVRPFILKDTKRMMARMTAWACSPDEHVRRLASEGCRPRLPWAMALPVFKRDPAPVLEILEMLRCDPSEYVRRSVANNLNDISKDHPDRVLDIARRWLREKPATSRLLKHACRTLLKAGDQRALALFGTPTRTDVSVKGLVIDPPRIHIGGTVDFRFAIVAGREEKADLRIEYAIDFLKANGRRGRKVFKVSERAVTGHHAISRQHRVQDMTTRIHQPGTHYLHVIINGHILASAPFDLVR